MLERHEALCMARQTLFDLWPFFSSSVTEENTGSVICAVVCVVFAISASVFPAGRDLWLESSFVSGEGVRESPSWDPTDLPICNNTALCFKFRAWIQAARVFTVAHDSLGRWRNVFGTYRRSCTASVYMCVCVYTVSCKSRSSPIRAPDCVFAAAYPPPSVSARNHTSGAFPLPPLCPAPPLSFACPGFRRPRIPWIHANKPVTDNPTRLDGPVNLSLTPPRLPIWWLPWQRWDWVGCPASCWLSQRVIWGCVL